MNGRTTLDAQAKKPSSAGRWRFVPWVRPMVIGIVLFALVLVLKVLMDWAARVSDRGTLSPSAARAFALVTTHSTFLVSAAWGGIGACVFLAKRLSDKLFRDGLLGGAHARRPHASLPRRHTRCRCRGPLLSPTFREEAPQELLDLHQRRTPPKRTGAKTAMPTRDTRVRYLRASFTEEPHFDLFLPADDTARSLARCASSHVVISNRCDAIPL